MALPKLTGLNRRRLLAFHAAKVADQTALRAMVPQADQYIAAYTNGVDYFVPQRANSAYWLALQGGASPSGTMLSDADLTALPEPPAWLDDVHQPVPANAVSPGVFAKYVRTYGGHVQGSGDDAYAKGVAALIAAVKAGNAAP